MEHRLWYDQDTKVVHLKFVGDYMTKDVEEIRRELKRVTEGLSNLQMCMHFSGGKVESRETREKSNGLLDEFGITHVAHIGGSAANRMLVKVMQKTGMIKAKGEFFKTEEEGINWLMSKR